MKNDLTSSANKVVSFWNDAGNIKRRWTIVGVTVIVTAIVCAFLF